MQRPKHKAIRNQAYLGSVRGKPCLICHMTGEAHHVNFAEPRGINLKVGDNWVVPLCHSCHMELHHYGAEKTWWDMNGVDPIRWAKENWEKFNGTK
jgi:hypothetical protein